MNWREHSLQQNGFYVQVALQTFVGDLWSFEHKPSGIDHYFAKKLSEMLILGCVHFKINITEGHLHMLTAFYPVPQNSLDGLANSERSRMVMPSGVGASAIAGFAIEWQSLSRAAKFIA